jgi:hypothetical protein
MFKLSIEPKRNRIELQDKKEIKEQLFHDVIVMRKVKSKQSRRSSKD